MKGTIQKQALCKPFFKYAVPKQETTFSKAVFYQLVDFISNLKNLSNHSYMKVCAVKYAGNINI